MRFEQIAEAEKILIYGCGKEGVSSLNFLSKKFPGKEIEIFDENPFCCGPKKNANFISPDLVADESCFDVIVVSPGISRSKLSHIPSEKLTSNTEIFFENIPEASRKKVIGISGTKGKSTTTKFCTEVLQKAGVKVKPCGNYGIPLLDLFDDFTSGKPDYLVAELSSFQLENLKTSPGIAIFLNIYSDHLDRHLNHENYFRAKQNLWKHQKEGDILIIPRRLKNNFSRLQSEVMPIISESLPADLFPKESNFRASYLLENFGVATKLLETLKLPKKAIAAITSKFKGLPYRLEFFTEKKGIKFYDDSLSTTPDSTIASVQFFGDRLGSIILGGQDRKVSFDELIRVIQEFSNAQIIVLKSETKNKITESCRKAKYEKTQVAINLEEAVQLCFEKTKPGSSCLLSTAAPSFDLFKNYEDKGTQFKRLVIAFNANDN